MVCFLGSGRTIHIYGWGLRHNLLQLAPYIAGDVTPIYQSVLAWCYIALVIIFVISGMFLKGKKGMILMSLAGLSYVVYVSIAIYVVTTNRLADFNIALQGYSTIQQQIGSIVVNARLETGFYMAYIAGTACFVLGLLRDIIQGKLKTPRRYAIILLHQRQINQEMTDMQETWEKAYANLENFMQAHPEIKLDVARICVPGDVRSRFWRLFESAGKALLREYFPAVKNNIEKLSCNYVNLKKEVKTQLNMKDNTSFSHCENFMCRPSDVLVKGRQGNALINLLNSNADFPELKTSAAKTIETIFASQCRCGYEDWVCLALLKLLRASRLLGVKFQKLSPTYILDFSPVEIPAPIDLDTFPNRDDSETLIMPIDFIAEAKACFVGFKMNIVSFQDSKSPAAKLSLNREWIPNGVLGRSLTGMTLIYISHSPKDIALVSDKLRICRPDLILECRWKADWFSQKNLSDIRSHHDALNPRLGTFIISNEVVSEELSGEISGALTHADSPADGTQSPKSDITLLNVGFDINRLQPLVDAITA